MCGITGIYEYGLGSGSVSADVVTRMRDTLRHRGPDGEGIWVSEDQRVGFGHRRLAIVDIAGGAQPMHGRNGEVLNFNGEIYNYPQLRRELERDGVVFATDCDTEVILHLYARHGRACLEHLNGMFAFALWDPREQYLFLARDRIGEKPLYFSNQGGRLVFGSEIKSLLKHPAVTAEVNAAAVEGYLANLVTTPPETLYRGISKLPPSSYAVCDRNGLRVSRYWNLFSPREWAEPSDDPAPAVRKMLDDSVNARLMADVPVGVLLSGGLDSTALVALLHEKARGLATYCVGFRDQPQLDERDEARRVARHYGTDHHDVEIDEATAVGFLAGMVHHQDEPLADPVCLPLHFVCELAASHQTKVVLAGEGSDELFWGYPSYVQDLARWRWTRRFLALPRPLRRALPHGLGSRRSDLREQLEGAIDGRPLPGHYPPGLVAAQRTRVLNERATVGPGWAASNDLGVSADPLSTYVFDTQEYEFGIRLPELLLMRIDRFSMANSIEARVPFLDPDLVDFVYRLPLQYKLADGETKLLLRRAIADAVPDWVLKRRKQGFGAPVNRWFGSRLGPLLHGLIDDEGLREYFDIEAVKGALDAHSRGDNRLPLWPILNFALWHRYWIRGEPIDGVLAPVAAGS